MFGSLKKNSEKITRTVNDFIKMIDVVPFDTNAADIYASLRNDLERSGTVVGNMDLLIASCAIANNAILVTNNEKHFSRIENLEVQNWS
jgi:tRNA(fMet)-specific endonuclease VapC